MEWVDIDGAQGEGGGQVLRSALTLAMVTGRGFRMTRIRAGRSKPGLLRQHLTAVAAAREICAAQVTGATPGSQELSFAPGAIRGGDYRYAIGTAGSCTLVLQTVLPALWHADVASSVTVTGGTHNPAAPPAEFLIAIWLPLLRRMGVDMDIELLRHGFYPAGGGELRATIHPSAPRTALELLARGEYLGATATAVVAGVPVDVARREIARLEARFGPLTPEVRSVSAYQGPGNVLLLELRYAKLSEQFIEFGARGVSAETVADRLAAAAQRYQAGGGAIGEYLADQLVLPMVLAGGGEFTTRTLSSHLATNIEVIRRFLPVTIDVTAVDGAHHVRIGDH